MRFSKITLRFLNKKHAVFKNYSAVFEHKSILFLPFSMYIMPLEGFDMRIP